MEFYPSSVGEYLSFLEKHSNGDLGNYFYRGETKDYGHTKLTANLYRGVKCDNGYKYNTWNTYLHAARAFYKNIPQLKEIECRNFMELCQHHGLPTPLLDVSLSPLVALYFSVQGDSCNGIIYVFSKNNFIRLDNKIFSYKYLSKCYKYDKNPLDLHLFINIQKIMEYMMNFVFNANTEQRQYVYTLAQSTIHDFIQYVKIFFNRFKLPYDKKLIQLLRKYDTPDKLISYVRNNSQSKNISMFSKNFIDFFKMLDRILSLHHGGISMSKIVSNVKIIGFLIYYANKHYSHSDEQFVPKDLNFYVNSTVNWNRIKVQRGKFIMQIPFKLTSALNRFPYVTYKPLYSERFIIGKKYKSSIRKELDSMGVNKMNLFMDKDHIAEYIKDKYYL